MAVAPSTRIDRRLNSGAGPRLVARSSMGDDEYQSLMDFGVGEAHSRLAARSARTARASGAWNVGAQFGASANSWNAAALVGWCRFLLRMSYREAVTDVAFA
jgi:hypothetical protein